MSDFPELVQSWQPFYTLTGTAAATLIGLLFVAVSIHTDMFRQRRATGLEHFAALTFNCYFYVLLIAIFFMIPGMSATALAALLLLLAVPGLLNAVLQQQRSRRYHAGRDGASLTPRFTAPVIALALLVVCSAGIWLRVQASFYGIVVVIVLLLAAASQNAWALLIGREIEHNG